MKLIRDGYKEIIDNKKLKNVTDEEALQLAIEKIDEELDELKASNFADKEEYCDLIEIIYTVARLKGFEQRDIAKAIYSKNVEKGAFFDNLVLED